MSTIIRNNNSEDILLEQQNAVAELQTLNTNGSKESKQDSQITEAESTNTKLDALNATDFATGAKQDDIITTINAIGGGGAPTAVSTTVSQNNASVLLLASNADRKGGIITNRAQGNQTLYINYNAAATLTSAIDLKKGDALSVEEFTGDVFGIWSAAGSGIASIIEITNP